MTYKSKFGFGCMRLPQTDKNDPTSINQELFNQMVDIYMEKGFNYFDTSYAYHNGMSEIAIRKAVVERYPRESFKICDKIPTWALTSKDDNEKFTKEMLERLGIDYFDVLFIHNINTISVAHFRKFRMIGVMCRSHTINIVLLHKHNIPFHILSRCTISRFRI